MQRISDLMDIPPILRKREGVNGQFNDTINLKSAHFGALSNAQAIKKGKGKGKGKARLPEGMASSSKKHPQHQGADGHGQVPPLPGREFGGHPQMPELFQMAHCVDRWPNCHRSMPAGKHGQKDEWPVFFGSHRLREATSCSASF